MSWYFGVKLSNSLVFPERKLRTRQVKEIERVKHKIRLVRNGSYRDLSFVIGGLPAQAESGLRFLIGGCWRVDYGSSAHWWRKNFFSFIRTHRVRRSAEERWKNLLGASTKWTVKTDRDSLKLLKCSVAEEESGKPKRAAELCKGKVTWCFNVPHQEPSINRPDEANIKLKMASFFSDQNCSVY